MSEIHPLKIFGKSISLPELMAGSLLLVFLIVPACSKATRYEPSPEEIIALLLEFPPIPVPPVTSANESTPELQQAIDMGQYHVGIETYGFRTYVSHVQDKEVHPLDGKWGFKWIRDPGGVAAIELRALCYLGEPQQCLYF